MEKKHGVIAVICCVMCPLSLNRVVFISGEKKNLCLFLDSFRVSEMTLPVAVGSSDSCCQGKQDFKRCVLFTLSKDKLL